jgi:Zn-dependent protease
MSVILGSEWCHNLAHAAAAKWVGHPADAIRITWGMPLLVYFDIEDHDVTPRIHMVRALGGPITNTIFWGTSLLFSRIIKKETIARDVIDAALGMNAFLVLAGMLPIPGIDGGVVLKWALVDKGQTPSQADETIRKVDIAIAAALGTGAALAFKRRKRFLGGIFAMFAGIALVTGVGLLREKT